MKRLLALLVVSVILLSSVPLVWASSSSPSTYSPTTGYVAYSLQVSANGTLKTALVNESVAQSSHAGKSVLTLVLDTASGNLTYSHLVNSTATLFPYLPSISSKNFSYTGKSGSITGQIIQQGTVQASFKGMSYAMTQYAFTVSYSSVKHTGSVKGTITAFPSGLVYGMSLESERGGAATVSIVSTSLVLQDGSPSQTLQAASLGIGASVAITAIALSLGVRYNRKQPESDAQKSDHWVD